MCEKVRCNILTPANRITNRLGRLGQALSRAITLNPTSMEAGACGRVSS